MLRSIHQPDLKFRVIIYNLYPDTTIKLAQVVARNLDLTTANEIAQNYSSPPYRDKVRAIIDLDIIRYEVDE